LFKFYKKQSMIEILKFMFSNVWIFFGCLVLWISTLVIMFKGIEDIILAIKQQPEDYD